MRSRPARPSSGSRTSLRSHVGWARIEVRTRERGSSMNELQIFVRLMDEPVDVWRPVRAEHFEGDRYRIVEQPYDRESEEWQFGAG